MDPDTEAYRQTLADGRTFAEWAVRVLAYLLLGSAAVVAGLWALSRIEVIDRLNVSFAWAGRLAGHAAGSSSAFRWLATRRLTALAAAGMSLAAGVCLGAFGADGGWLGRHGRFWYRTPHQMGVRLAAVTARGS